MTIQTRFQVANGAVTFKIIQEEPPAARRSSRSHTIVKIGETVWEEEDVGSNGRDICRNLLLTFILQYLGTYYWFNGNRCLGGQVFGLM